VQHFLSLGFTVVIFFSFFVSAPFPLQHPARRKKETWRAFQNPCLSQASPNAYQ
jgi:hypothetical protein